ncbi:MAG: HK97 gp10 family phage protein [Betaproteobacteria bacterium]|nr:HK97 gp10 family phage protein [Betaproteobacteria bacterium]
MTDLKVEGLAELQALLDDLPAKIEANVVRGGLRAGAQIIADEAKRLCPVGDHVPKGETPGALRESIHVSMRSKHGRVQASIKAGGKKAWYAHMVEYGTARHWIKPKNRKSLFVAGLFKEAIDHPGAKKQPFMRPAIDNKAQEAIEAVRDYMKSRIEKEASKK